MKKTGLAIFLLVVLVSSPGFAFVDAIVSTAKAAKDEVYQKFMMVKAIEQLKALRDNYEASMRYYAMIKKLNEGKGILPNIATKVGDIGDKLAKEAQQQFEDDWINDKGYHSDLDRAIGKMDDYASGKVRYAGKVFSKSLEAQKEGERISHEADSLDSKNTQKMMLKTQALQLQLAAQTNANMAQLLDVNTRTYKLQLEAKQERLRDWDIFDKSVKILQGPEKARGGN
jgi:hypothetical protein